MEWDFDVIQELKKNEAGNSGDIEKGIDRGELMRLDEGITARGL